MKEGHVEKGYRKHIENKTSAVYHSYLVIIYIIFSKFRIKTVIFLYFRNSFIFQPMRSTWKCLVLSTNLGSRSSWPLRKSAFCVCTPDQGSFFPRLSTWCQAGSQCHGWPNGQVSGSIQTLFIFHHNLMESHGLKSNFFSFRSNDVTCQCTKFDILFSKHGFRLSFYFLPLGSFFRFFNAPSFNNFVNDSVNARKIPDFCGVSRRIALHWCRRQSLHWLLPRRYWFHDRYDGRWSEYGSVMDNGWGSDRGSVAYDGWGLDACSMAGMIIGD